MVENLFNKLDAIFGEANSGGNNLGTHALNAFRGLD